MKTRRHHNNKGSHKIRRGKTYDEVRRMARRLGVKAEPRKAIVGGLELNMDPDNPGWWIERR